MRQFFFPLLLGSLLLLGDRSGVYAQEKASWKEEAFSLAFSPDSKTLAVGAREIIKFFDPATAMKRSSFDTRGKIQGLAYSTDGRRVAAGVYLDQSLRLWDVANGKQLSIDLPKYKDSTYEEIKAVGWLQDKRTLVTLGNRWGGKGDTHFIGIWETDKARRIATMPVACEHPCLAVSPVGVAFAYAGNEKEPAVRLWPKWTQSADKPKLLKGHATHITALAFSPNGKQLVSASRDSIKFWNALTGEPLPDHPTPGMEVFCLAFSPNGKMLLAGGTGRGRISDKTARIQLSDVATGKELATLDGHKEPVFAAAFSADGTLLATSDLNTVRLWDLQALPLKAP